MELQTHLTALAQPDLAARRAALEAVFLAEGFTPEIQQGEEGPKVSIPARNYYLWPLPESDLSPCPLFCAHYDAHPGSPGANDNAAAVCILISLAKTLRQKNIRAAFAFFDGEECGHTGAKLFESTRTRDFSVLVNLDVCGYGDTIALYAKGGEKKPAAAVFCDKKRLSAHHGRMVRFMPEGDQVCFHSRRQPVLSLSVMPLWDVRYLDAIARQGTALLGRPPEVQMMLEDMEVSATMHGGSKDRPEWIQPEAMEQVYNYLLDALTAHVSSGRGAFGIFNARG